LTFKGLTSKTARDGVATTKKKKTKGKPKKKKTKDKKDKLKGGAAAVATVNNKGTTKAKQGRVGANGKSKPATKTNKASGGNKKKGKK
jgi:hypothetical protein